MSMPDAFLAAIIEDPDDDTPRLVYADWLEENGNSERAEFIRLQCRLATLDRYAQERRPLVKREQEMLQRFGKHWLRQDRLSDWIDPDSLDRPHYTGVHYRRGFISSGGFRSPDDYLKVAKSLNRHTPLERIRLANLYTFATQMDEFRAERTYYWRGGIEYTRPQLADEDVIPTFPEPEEFRRFVASPWFGQLRSFAMNSLYCDRRHLEILLSATLTAGLRELDLSGNFSLNQESWGPFSEAATLTGLESLALDRCRLGVPGLQAVVSSPHLSNLRQLSLRGECDRFGAEGFHLLTASRCLPRLQSLRLCDQHAGGEGLAALAAWPGLARLTKLDLAGNSRESYRAALGAFLASPHWGQLRELHLDGSPITTLDALEAFLDGPQLSTLRVLSLQSEFQASGALGPCQDEAARLVVQCPRLAQDLELHFCESNLSEEARRLLLDRFGDGLILTPPGL
jgi:uncharacterized protein (TIGR02996 family)